MAGKVELLEGLLRMLPKAAQRVDLGDMTRPVTATRLEALEKMVPKADDWGWKGGKPGELTGGDLLRILDETRDKIPMSKYAGAYVHNAKELDKVFLQLSKSRNAGVVNALERARTRIPNHSRPAGRLMADRLAARRLGSEFAMLESADIPREWTGKVFTAIEQFPNHMIWSYADKIRDAGSPRKAIAQLLSDALRPMTNDQRETFLVMLPEWEGSLDELADAARSL